MLHFIGHITVLINSELNSFLISINLTGVSCTLHEKVKSKNKVAGSLDLQELG